MYIVSERRSRTAPFAIVADLSSNGNTRRSDPICSVADSPHGRDEDDCDEGVLKRVAERESCLRS